MSACPGSKHCALWQQRDGRFKRAQAGVIILLRNFCQPHSPGALQVRGAGSAHAVGSPTCPFPRTIMSQAALRGELAAVADVASNALTMVVTVSHGHSFVFTARKGVSKYPTQKKTCFLVLSAKHHHHRPWPYLAAFPGAMQTRRRCKSCSQSGPYSYVCTVNFAHAVPAWPLRAHTHRVASLYSASGEQSNEYSRFSLQFTRMQMLFDETIRT
jgi:hypothetical protein